MLSKRIIPCLDIKDGRVVKGVNFVNLFDAGSAVEFAELYSSEGADELVFLDITASIDNRATRVELVKETASAINIPFTVGGGIRNLEDIENLLRAGADKVSLNSIIVNNPSFITLAAKQFGSQAIVAAIDIKYINGSYKVFSKGGTSESTLEGFQWCKQVEELGAGEILLTSMNKDGTKTGFDIPFISRLQNLVNIPVIASGGAGTKYHFADAFKAGADACLAASLFHYDELKIMDLKNFLYTNNINVRMI